MQDAFGEPQTIVVLGGTSDIARAVVRALAPRRLRRAVLAGRDPSRLAAAAAEARAAGVDVPAEVALDATDPAGAAGAVEAAFDAAGHVDLVLMAVGELSRQAEELDAGRTAQVTTVTYGWPAAALTRAAALLAAQGSGRIVVLSSVAGVRVRRANFVYGAAKAGLDAMARGLGEALRGTGVVVQVVRPGFVRTRMTEGMPPAPFATSAEAVADAIVAGLQTDAPVIWVPPVLRWVFLVLVHLPAALWRRMPG